jgi:hypothetical protein
LLRTRRKDAVYRLSVVDGDDKPCSAAPNLV